MNHSSKAYVWMTTIALGLLLAGSAMAEQIPGWEANWPSPQQALQGCDPKVVQAFRQDNAALIKNPKDEAALVNRGVEAHRLARTSRYEMFWIWLAAKDLEQAVRLDPKDFAAWHNYGDVNYGAGDDWAHHSHANALRALDAFNHALALNPRSPRSYMGRGWVYYELNDQAHANADFQKALQLDPSLRADIQKEIGNIQERHRQADAARGVVRKLSSYFVEKSATNYEACQRYKCFWTNGECRCSTALNPGN
jgi:tetratricopeptide (TPR) repeat protein